MPKLPSVCRRCGRKVDSFTVFKHVLVQLFYFVYLVGQIGAQACYGQSHRQCHTYAKTPLSLIECMHTRTFTHRCRGAGKFFGVGGIFARIPPNLFETFLPTCFLMTFFWVTFKRNYLRMFFCKRWRAIFPGFNLGCAFTPRSSTTAFPDAVRCRVHACSLGDFATDK